MAEQRNDLVKGAVVAAAAGAVAAGIVSMLSKKTNRTSMRENIYTMLRDSEEALDVMRSTIHQIRVHGSKIIADKLDDVRGEVKEVGKDD